MTLERWLIAGSVVIFFVIVGGTFGVAVFAVWFSRVQDSRRQRELAEQAEAHKVEMRELTSYNVRLEERVSELEIQVKTLLQALADARIPVPKTGPLSLTVGRDATIGGDFIGGSKSG